MASISCSVIFIISCLRAETRYRGEERRQPEETIRNHLEVGNAQPCVPRTYCLTWLKPLTFEMSSSHEGCASNNLCDIWSCRKQNKPHCPMLHAELQQCLMLCDIQEKKNLNKNLLFPTDNSVHTNNPLQCQRSNTPEMISVRSTSRPEEHKQQTHCKRTRVHTEDGINRQRWPASKGCWYPINPPHLNVMSLKSFTKDRL